MVRWGVLQVNLPDLADVTTLSVSESCTTCVGMTIMNGSGMDVSTRSVACVEVLRQWCGDLEADRLVRVFSTWGQLLVAADNRHLSGTTADPELLPRRHLAACGLLERMDALTRYDSRFPQQILELRRPPALVYIHGQWVPDTTLVSVVGAQTASPVGVEIARNTALSAAAAGVGIVARTDTLLGRTALLETLRAGGYAVGIRVPGFAVSSAQDAVSGQVLDSGGALFYGSPPSTGFTPSAFQTANALTVGLGHAVLVAEIGMQSDADTFTVSTAVHACKYLIVASYGSHRVSGRYVPDSMLGCDILATPGAFSPTYFGTNERIDSRVAAAGPAADAVVSTGDEIAAVLTSISGHQRT